MLVIGYLGLIIGFGCLGLLKAMQIRKRPREIREMINALALLDTEIYWGATPLPEAFAILQQRTDPPWREFFAELESEIRKGNNASKAWVNVITRHQRRTCLSEEDWRAIRDIGKGLGRSDRSEQHKMLELAQKHLAHVDEKARQQVDGKAKMWSYLGFLGGLAVVIFIL